MSDYGSRFERMFKVLLVCWIAAAAVSLVAALVALMLALTR
jgi:hypothetical protein